MVSFKFLLIFILLLLSELIFAQYDFNENCKKAYSDIISLKFEEGKKLIEIEKSQNPENNIPYLLENYVDFLTIIVGEEEDTFEKLKSNKILRINRLSEGNKSSPYYRYCLANVYLQWAFARIKFGEYFTAVFEINKAYHLLEQNQKLFPEFLPNYIGLGLLHALIGTIPDNYKWLTKLAGMDGSISQGINELTLVLDSATDNSNYEYLKPESLFFLSFIELNLKSNKKEALKLMDRFKNYDSDNLLICFSKASILKRTGNNDKAIEVLLSRPETNEYFPFFYLDYLTGLAKLNRLDNDACIYFFNYIQNFKGSNYIKSAYQKIAWFYLIKSDKKKYKEYISRVLRIDDKSMVDADKQAVIEAESDEIPNVYLLKARLLFDGGYYQKAIDVLKEEISKNDLKTAKDSLEYNYRFGRIYHEWGKVEEAIPYYEITLISGAGFPYYFAANSALQLGLIYENKLEFDKAKYYYKKCLSLKFKEYKTSISQKAKAGLNRVENKK